MNHILLLHTVIKFNTFISQWQINLPLTVQWFEGFLFFNSRCTSALFFYPGLGSLHECTWSWAESTQGWAI